MARKPGRQTDLYDPLWDTHLGSHGSPAKLDLEALLAQAAANVQAKAKAKTKVRGGRRQSAVSDGSPWTVGDAWIIEIENHEGTSDKFWKIEGTEYSKTVRVTWGKKMPGYLRELGRQAISVAEANKRLKKKLRDGYVVTRRRGPVPDAFEG